tara:strand:+ start:996 stop:1400 length:405 start_codon:yes stop_codon:yes gene_type:complete
MILVKPDNDLLFISNNKTYNDLFIRKILNLEFYLLDNISNIEYYLDNNMPFFYYENNLIVVAYRIKTISGSLIRPVISMENIIYNKKLNKEIIEKTNKIKIKKRKQKLYLLTLIIDKKTDIPIDILRYHITPFI